MATAVKTCNCKHESQDKMYGSKQRVHNKCNKGYRCTVCGSINASSDGTPKK